MAVGMASGRVIEVRANVHTRNGADADRWFKIVRVT